MKRALILVAPLALIVGLGACGDDDDEPESTVADVTIDGVTVPDISIPDISLPDISIPDISLPDISIPDISIPDISIPDISIPDNAEDIVRQVFPNLDDDQVSCLVENMGGDVDPNEAMQLLEECDIEIADLQPGG